MNKIKNSKSFRIGLSILVAFIIWLYVDITDTTPREITVWNVPVELIGEDVLMERGLMVSSISQTKVNLYLQGSPTVIYKLDPDEITVQVDLNSITSAREYDLEYKINYPDSITSNMVTVTNASVYRITVEVVELYKKSITVEGKYTGSAADGYMVGEMTFSQDTILVSGEQSAVSNINYAKVSVNLDGASENVVQMVDFQLVDFNGQVVDKSQFYLDTDTIQVTVPILKIKELPLELELVESPGSMASMVDVDIEPKSITVAGSNKSLASMESILLKTIDLSQLTQNTTLVIPIPLPSGSTNLSGVTEAKVTIQFKSSVETRSYTVTNISCENLEGREVSIVTQELTVSLRGVSSLLDQISEVNIRVVADLSEVGTSRGNYSVPATVYVDGSDQVGAVGTYQVAVRIT